MFTVEALTIRGRPCRVCGGESGTGISLSPSTSVFPVSIIPPSLMFLLSEGEICKVWDSSSKQAPFRRKSHNFRFHPDNDTNSLDSLCLEAKVETVPPAYYATHDSNHLQLYYVNNFLYFQLKFLIMAFFAHLLLLHPLPYHPTLEHT